MRQLFQRTSKPPIGTPLDWSNALTENLIAFYPCWEGGGSTVADVVNGLTATISGATWAAGSSSVYLNCNGANYNASVTLPLSLQRPISATTYVTIACGFRYLTSEAPAGGFDSTIFGITYNSAQTTPYYYLQFAQNSGTLRFQSSNAGSAFGSSSVGTMSAGKDYAAVTSFRNGVQATTVNGVLNTASTSNFWGPAYTATSQIMFGSGGNQSGCGVYWGAIWARLLQPAEQLMITQSINSIWQIFRPYSSLGELVFAPRLTNPIIRAYQDRTGSDRKIWAD